MSIFRGKLHNINHFWESNSSVSELNSGGIFSIRVKLSKVTVLLDSPGRYENLYLIATVTGQLFLKWTPSGLAPSVSVSEKVSVFSRVKLQENE